MITEIEIEDVGTVRPLNVYQIMRLKRIRGPNRKIAPFAMAIGLTYRQFRGLPVEKQEEIIHACGILRSAKNCAS